MKRKKGLNTDMETANVSLLSQQILDMQKSIEAVRKMRDTKLGQIGNIVHDSVPVAKDEVSQNTYIFSSRKTQKSHRGERPVP